MIVPFYCKPKFWGFRNPKKPPITPVKMVKYVYTQTELKKHKCMEPTQIVNLHTVEHITVSYTTQL